MAWHKGIIFNIFSLNTIMNISNDIARSNTINHNTMMNKFFCQSFCYASSSPF